MLVTHGAQHGDMREVSFGVGRIDTQAAGESFRSGGKVIQSMVGRAEEEPCACVGRIAGDEGG